MKHTKGTWEPFSYHNLDIAQEGVRYGVSSSNGKYIGEEMTEGDANLIANAPEMLAVLKEYVDGYELHDPSEVEEMRMAVRTKDYRKSANVLFMALEVIAKAEGGE